MKKLCWRLLVPALLMSLAGCGGGAAPDDSPAPAPEEEPARLGEQTETSLADLLNKPRAELAEMADDLLTTSRMKLKARRSSNEVFLLLLYLHLPIAVPGLREAKFSPRLGISLPPYAADGAPDADLALHLAGYGDVEAARKLADPADADLLRRIDACACGRNYPVEWTRVVWLLLHSAQYRVATGDVDGATELVLLHRQLKSLLDERAARGPLGSALLACGRPALARAAAAWKAGKQEVLAGQVREAVAAWGEVHPPPSPVPVGTSRTEVGRLLHAEAGGRAVVAPNTTRALDLFDLPLPQDDADNVVAFFDRQGGLEQVLVVFHPRTSEHYPLPSDLAFLLREPLPEAAAAPGGENAEGTHGMLRAEYPVGGLVCDVSLAPRNNVVGGLARFRGAGPAGPADPLVRDLGTVHLDRSFEQNRLRLNPDEQGASVETERPAALAGLKAPLGAMKPTAAVLERPADHDVVSRLTLRYNLERLPSLAEMLLPVWTAWGPSRFEGVDDDHGGHLSFRWEDAATGYELRLPHGDRPVPELEVADRHPAADLACRDSEGAAFDRAERQARFAAGKPRVRLTRSVAVDAIRLGMDRDAVRQVLPGGRTVQSRPTADGLLLVFTGDPARDTPAVLRQLVLRFDGTNRLVEMRARYQDGAAAPGGGRGVKALLKGLKKQGGAPTEVAAPWASLWPDLGAQSPAPVCSRWQDDTTAVTYQVDAGGAEVVVRDVPPSQESTAPVPPLEYLPRGPEGCRLGDAHDALLRRWGVTKPTVTGGALVLSPADGPYDALLVWFEGDRIARVVARHRLGSTQAMGAGELGDAVREVWGRDIRTLGWPSRQDLADNVLHGVGWNDDRTRVRTFWQEPDQGPCRVYTEWKQL